MARRDPFRGHRFPKDVILLAVRWYCRYPLSYRDVRVLSQTSVFLLEDEHGSVVRGLARSDRRGF
jgi:transposase-like protein